MGMCASGDIFQAKVDEILSDIDMFKRYINDILEIGKGSFYQNIYQLRVIFASLCAVELKVKCPKFILGLK